MEDDKSDISQSMFSQFPHEGIFMSNNNTNTKNKNIKQDASEFDTNVNLLQSRNKSQIDDGLNKSVVKHLERSNSDLDIFGDHNMDVKDNSIFGNQIKVIKGGRAMKDEAHKKSRNDPNVHNTRKTIYGVCYKPKNRNDLSFSLGTNLIISK